MTYLCVAIAVALFVAGLWLGCWIGDRKIDPARQCRERPYPWGLGGASQSDDGRPL